MATASTKTRQARPIKAVEGSNFEPKRVRKAKRKPLVRGLVGNTVQSVRSEWEDRAEFYRNLRMMKLRRKHVAREMAILADMVNGLRGEIRHIENRYPEYAAGALDEAHALAKEALGSVSVAADEYRMFSRARVYYVKEL